MKDIKLNIGLEEIEKAYYRREVEIWVNDLGDSPIEYVNPFKEIKGKERGIDLDSFKEKYNV